jgi:hypothetical protein
MIAVLAALLGPAPALAQFDVSSVADADGDGFIGRDEFTAFYALEWLVLAVGKTTVDVKQANPALRAVILSVLPTADGAVERDQLLDAAPNLYAEADKNRDGVVSSAEMKAWIATEMAPPAR